LELLLLKMLLDLLLSARPSVLLVYLVLA